MSQLWKDPVYGPLAQGLYARCGLVFEGGQVHLFRKRVDRRATELGYPSAAAYVAALRGTLGEAEYEHMVETLTVNETYFFREQEHFQLLVDKLWPAWAREGDGPVRVWSAACSTGCEPYTLAILLRERRWVGPGRPRVEILATDVNTTVLRDAGSGLYGEFALRQVSPYYRDKYFRREGGLYRLDPEVRKMVTFRRYNLLRPDGLLPPGGFHAVLCRNVLIYFDQEAKRKAVGGMVRALKPGGALIIGRSESLFSVPEAPPIENHDGLLIYRKPAPVR